MNFISEEYHLLTRLSVFAQSNNVHVVLRGSVDSYVVFSDGQKLSFRPKTVDEDQLYVSINTYNRIIEAQNNHGATTS